MLENAVPKWNGEFQGAKSNFIFYLNVLLNEIKLLMQVNPFLVG